LNHTAEEDAAVEVGLMGAEEAVAGLEDAAEAVAEADHLEEAVGEAPIQGIIPQRSGTT
jgi:hypothetical protein